MSNIVPHPKSGILCARKVVPEDARHAFDGKREKWKSLRTRDPKVANLRAAPVLAEWEQRIEAARSGRGAPAPPSASATGLVNPDAALDAIERWKERTITETYIRQFNGLDKHPMTGDDSVRRADLTYRLSQSRVWEQLPEFDAKLVVVLHAADIHIAASHGVIPSLRRAFREAWHEALRVEEQFRWGDFTNAPDGMGSSGFGPVTSRARSCIFTSVDRPTPLNTVLSPTMKSARSASASAVMLLIRGIIASRVERPSSGSSVRSLVASSRAR